MPNDYTIAAYYFPNYHPDARNAITHGAGWTEWDLVRRAQPRYQGHNQPRVPLWGYEDEADPAVMEKKISTAAEHGVDVFIYDWYAYDDGFFLQRGLEEGYLGARNNERVKFALMWANHDWQDIHPARLRECQEHANPLLYSGRVTPESFERITTYCIEHYFAHPSYWKIGGAPYFSIYDLPMLVKSLGGVNAAAHALAQFRAQTKAAGFADLHLNQVLWNTGVLPGETEIREPGEMLNALGFDSFTSYVWVHHAALDAFPETPYQHVFDQYLRYWSEKAARIALPYYPNASMGWDPSPRTLQSDAFLNAGYPFTPAISGGTPAAFESALRSIRERIEQSGGAKIVTVNAWNEWTEGSYLEPDTATGMGYLEAIRAVFGRG